MAAEDAARVRSARLITVSGRDVDFGGVQDWYRRDEAGQPMPAEWRDLLGQVRVPWNATTLSEEATA